MRKLLRQIKRELKTAKHCAIYVDELSRVWPDDGSQREPKVTRFAEIMAFASAFIVTAYAPFSMKSLASVAKSNLSACCSTTALGAKNSEARRAIIYASWR